MAANKFAASKGEKMLKMHSHKMHLSLIATVAALGATSLLTTPARAQVETVGPPAARGWRGAGAGLELRHPWGIASKNR